MWILCCFRFQLSSKLTAHSQQYHIRLCFKQANQPEPENHKPLYHLLHFTMSYTSESSSSSSSTIQWKYDVFLSFRGEDTRKNFTDHLYKALDQKGIITFRDDEELERGKEISSDLLKAIEESRFSIIILSKNYASSKWCLDELSKIVECINMKGHTAFPIFHYVDPSEVRKQTGDFKKYFDKHEEEEEEDMRDGGKEKKKKVQRWRDAVTQVANLSGWHLQGRHEAELIQEVVDEIWRGLNQTLSSVGGDFIGIDLLVKKMIADIVTGLDEDVGFIGILGMGGIGKTTIARIVYDKLSWQYEGNCFLANVREVSGKRGLVHLQEQLLYKVIKVKILSIQDVHEGIRLIRRCLSRKKVFLVLDDVDHFKQLNWLAGKLGWFGSGSRIVVTTRDERLLINHGIKNIYKVEGLNHYDSIQLLHLKAFKYKQPTNDYVEVSNRVVEYTNGLPLALEVLGSLLCDRSVKEWRSVLDILRQVPDDDILKKLRISYDGLSKMEKKIFLDIACFFKGEDKERVMEILDSCGFGPDIGISRLIEKSLITISENKLWMHGFLQELGWEIVREEQPMKPGKWSRLWLSKDISNVLTKNMGTYAIEGIMKLDKPKQEIMHLNGKSFSTMNNLRLLKISKVHLSEDLEYLSNELRVLKWPGYPLSFLPPSFEPHELFKLSMCHSRLEYLWNGMKSLKHLKTIKLNHSHSLIRTPDLTEVPNLERLDLEGCTGLLEVHESVAVLKRLIVLNCKDCKSLVSFPSNVSGLLSLQILNLYGCSKLDKLPQNLGEVECLEELDISGTSIRNVPCSIVKLNNLKILSAHGCNGKQPKCWSSFFFSLLLPKRNSDFIGLQLPPLSGLCSLTKLDLSDCNFSDGENLNDLGNLSSLEELNLSRNSFVSLPTSINRLSNLQILLLEECQRLQSLPELPPEIAFIGVGDCSSMEILMAALEKSTSQELALYFLNCFKLVENQGRENSLAVLLLKHRLQRLPNHTSQFHILLPGSEVPEWFSHRSDTPCVRIPLAPNWINDQFMEFVVCAAFERPEHWDGYEIHYQLLIIIAATYFNFSVPSFTTMESNHHSLSYLSRELFEKTIQSPSEWESITANIHNVQGTNTCMKGCGIRLVYKQDLEYSDVDGNSQELPLSEDNNAMNRTAIRESSFFERSSIKKYYYTSPFHFNPSNYSFLKRADRYRRY